jgi:hypothetical protein
MLKSICLNGCISAPGLAIATGSSALAKYGNTFSFKANTRWSGSISTANAPSLALATYQAPYPSGTAGVAGVLATGYYRIYTLVGTIPVTGSSTFTLAYSWLASADVKITNDAIDLGIIAWPDATNQAAIGFVIVQNASGSNFTPGTTALDAGSITTTYIDNYAFIGA